MNNKLKLSNLNQFLVWKKKDYQELFIIIDTMPIILKIILITKKLNSKNLSITLKTL